MSKQFSVDTTSFSPADIELLQPEIFKRRAYVANTGLFLVVNRWNRKSMKCGGSGKIFGVLEEITALLQFLRDGKRTGKIAINHWLFANFHYIEQKPSDI